MLELGIYVCSPTRLYYSLVHVACTITFETESFFGSVIGTPELQDLRTDANSRKDFESFLTPLSRHRVLSHIK